VNGKEKQEMNGSNVLLDSNILIAISKNQDDLNNYLDNYNKVFISIISYIEVLGYDFINKIEEEIILKILQNIETIDLNVEIADIAVKVRKKNKIKLPDSVIYATAVFLNAELMTKNTDDFKDLY